VTRSLTPWPEAVTRLDIHAIERTVAGRPKGRGHANVIRDDRLGIIGSPERYAAWCVGRGAISWAIIWLGDLDAGRAPPPPFDPAAFMGHAQYVPPPPHLRWLTFGSVVEYDGVTTTVSGEPHRTPSGWIVWLDGVQKGVSVETCEPIESSIGRRTP
jgi:hypothetical protein